MVRLELILTEEELQKFTDLVTNWWDMKPLPHGWPSETMRGILEKVTKAIAYEQQQKKEEQK